MAARAQCKGHIHLQKMKEMILERGGEGIMLRRIGSLYEPGRSQSLIKIKVLLLLIILIFLLLLLIFIIIIGIDGIK